MKKETNLRIPGRGVIGCFFAGTGGPAFADPRTWPKFRVGKNVRQDVPVSRGDLTVRKGPGEPGRNIPAGQNRNHFIMTSASSPFA